MSRARSPMTQKERESREKNYEVPRIRGKGDDQAEPKKGGLAFGDERSGGEGKPGREIEDEMIELGNAAKKKRSRR